MFGLCGGGGRFVRAVLGHSRFVQAVPGAQQIRPGCAAGTADSLRLCCRHSRFIQAVLGAQQMRPGCAGMGTADSSRLCWAARGSASGWFGRLVPGPRSPGPWAWEGTNLVLGCVAKGAGRGVSGLVWGCPPGLHHSGSGCTAAELLFGSGCTARGWGAAVRFRLHCRGVKLARATLCWGWGPSVRIRLCRARGGEGQFGGAAGVRLLLHHWTCRD